MSKQGQDLVELAQLSPVVGCGSPLVREPIPVEQSVELSRAFKALGDPVRLRLVSLIASHDGGEACVCDLNDAFDLSQPTISHHLKVLHQAGLLSREKRGVWVYYQARPEAMQAMLNLFVTVGAPA